MRLGCEVNVMDQQNSLLTLRLARCGFEFGLSHQLSVVKDKGTNNFEPQFTDFLSSYDTTFLEECCRD